MCGDIPGYKRPSKERSASAAACLKVPCTKFGSFAYTLIGVRSIHHGLTGSVMPLIKCNLAFIGAPATTVMYVPEKK